MFNVQITVEFDQFIVINTCVYVYNIVNLK